MVEKMGEVLKRIIAHGLHIGNIKMVHLSRDSATEFYKEIPGTEIS